MGNTGHGGLPGSCDTPGISKGQAKSRRERSLKDEGCNLWAFRCARRVMTQLTHSTHWPSHLHLQ